MTVCAVATPTLSIVAAGSKAATVAGETVTVSTTADNEYTVKAVFTLELIGDTDTAPYKTFDEAGVAALTKTDAVVADSAPGTWTATTAKEWTLTVAAAKAGQHALSLTAMPSVYDASNVLAMTHGT